MSNRVNKYIVTVSFNASISKEFRKTFKSAYISGKTYTDELTFFSKSFKLTACRTRVFTDGTILVNEKNSFNEQIFKGLLYFYACSSKFPKIKDVEIQLVRKNSNIYKYTKESGTLIQPLPGVNRNPERFNPLSIIFDNTSKSNAVRIALSYWLKGVASSDRYYKFDHFWRAFNSLYRFVGATQNKDKEIDCLIAMRTVILKNSSKLKGSCSLVKNMTKQDLREFRWRDLILNDYPIIKKMETFRDFIFRYTDKRVMQLFSDMLPYREDYLKQKGLLDDVKNHLKTNVKSNDAEVLAILTIKYAYFIRCKFFHGEVPDSTFKLHFTRQDQNIDTLNCLLSKLIFELIDNDLL